MRRIIGIAVCVVLASVGCKRSTPKAWKPGSGRPPAAAVACPADRPPGEPRADGECKADADCTKGKNGRCLTLGPRVQRNECTYDACFTDADCTTGGPCECSSGGNHCLAGNCKVDSDCGSGGSCGRSMPMSCGGGDPEYRCRTNDDDCVESQECPDNGQCVFLPEVGHWGCKKYPDCPVG